MMVFQFVLYGLSGKETEEKKGMYVMNPIVNPVIPESVRNSLNQEKQQAYTLYLDMIVDGTASMYTVYPGVYYAVTHFLDALAKYEVSLELGLTLIRNEQEGDMTEKVVFGGDREYFTKDPAVFISRLKNVELYGGGRDGKEAVHTAIRKSLEKFPFGGRNRAIMVFTDAYGCSDTGTCLDYPIGQAIFFTTEEMSEEDFAFAMIGPDGSLDEEASPSFFDIREILKPVSPEFVDDVVKPLKDLLKGVSIGA